MPFYDFKCSTGEDHGTKEVFCGIKDTPEVACEVCGSAMTKSFTPAAVMGHVRGSTLGKAYKEQKVRRKRNAELGIKQLEKHGGASKLVPNVAGEETSTWKEASMLARDSGKDDTVYKKMAEAEAHAQNSRGIDERKWKKAKEIARNVM